MVKQLIMTHSNVKETPHNRFLRYSCPEKQKTAATVYNRTMKNENHTYNFIEHCVTKLLSKFTLLSHNVVKSAFGEISKHGTKSFFIEI